MPSVYPAICQHGECSDLSYVMSGGEVGSIILLWIGALFLNFVILLIGEV